MSDCIRSVIEKEVFWDKWKENKCPNFEKPVSQNLKQRKRDQNRANRLIGNNIAVPAKERELNWVKNGQNMRKYFKQPPESIDAEGKSVNVKPSDLPTMSDYLVDVLQDIDPDQGIEEAYKHKKQQVFSWRFLRQISFVDLVNFHGKPEMQKQFNKFEGNVEEQALILYSRNKKKDIELSNGDV